MTIFAWGFTGALTDTEHATLQAALDEAEIDGAVCRHADATTGYRGWVSGTGRGEPFDSQFHRRVAEVLDAAAEDAGIDMAHLPRYTLQDVERDGNGDLPECASCAEGDIDEGERGEPVGIMRDGTANDSEWAVCIDCLDGCATDYADQRSV